MENIQVVPRERISERIVGKIIDAPVPSFELGRSDEQIGDFPIPRFTAAHAAPSPVNENIVPAPVVNFMAPAPVLKDKTSALAVCCETPRPVMKDTTPAPAILFSPVVQCTCQRMSMLPMQHPLP